MEALELFLWTAVQSAWGGLNRHRFWIVLDFPHGHSSGVLQRSTMCQDPRQGGRSLIELLMTLAIIAILAAVTVPEYRTFVARTQARTVAVEIASELRMARQLAMSRRERLRLRFDRIQQTITLERAEAGGVLDVYRYRDKGIEVEEPTAGSEVLFHPSGRSATATTIVIRDSSGRRTLLTVSLVGRVTIS